jgi:hypothetical protein
LQDELTADAVDVTILGVNQVGNEAGNEEMMSGRDLPWLAETAELDVWSAWRVTYRDVIVLDGQNQVLDIYNLTKHDLADPANTMALDTLLRDAAAAGATLP